ncbi:MAG: MFS transporter [Pseudomonadota bacterium]
MENKNHHWWLLFAVSLMCLMINIDYTAVNLSLVTIAHSLKSSLNVIQWILSAYMLAWAILVIPAGKCVDIFGQKRSCLTGMFIFLIGSVMAGLAHSAWMLIIARILQGISGAIYVPSLYALIFKFFPKERLGLAMGLMSVGVGFGMAVGPTFGGIVLTYLGWRWIFFINIPIALIAMIIIKLNVSQSLLGQSEEKVDKTGSLLLTLVLLSLMFTLSKAHYWGIISYPFLGMILFTLLVFIVFLFHQRLQATPMIPFSLFLNRSYTAVVFAFLLEQYVFSASMVLIALFLQKVLGIVAFKASLMFLALNLLFGAVAPFGGIIVDKIGVKWPAVLGLFVLAIGLAGFASLNIHSPYAMIYLCLVITGLGMGIAFASLNSGMAKTVDQSKAGLASSIFLFAALLGNVLGVTITTMLYESAALKILFRLLPSKPLLSTLQKTQLQNTVHYIGNHTHQLSAFSQAYQNKIMSLLPQVLSHGVTVAMIVAMAMSLLACLLCVLFIKRGI